MATQWQCPIHGTSRWVPPGISQRTGKAYVGFWSCTERDCPEKPPRGMTLAPPAPAPRAAAPKPQSPPNWDKIAEGKCRSLAICAWIQSGVALYEFWPVEHAIVRYMMEGAVPEETSGPTFGSLPYDGDEEGAPY